MIVPQTIVEIVRLEENALFGTFGVLLIDKQVFCVTLEPSDVENTRFISAIPAQQYFAIRTNSPRFGATFEIIGVPGRTDILFHAGNRSSNTNGCVLLAEKFGKLYGDRAILNSGKTHKEFMYILRDCQGFHLTVKEMF